MGMIPRGNRYGTFGSRKWLMLTSLLHYKAAYGAKSITAALPCALSSRRSSYRGVLKSSDIFYSAAVQIRLLLGRQLVYLRAERGQLQPRDLGVYFSRHWIHFALERARSLCQILERLGLKRKTHVHYLCRMAVACRKVDESALGEQVEHAPVRQAIAQMSACAAIPTAISDSAFTNFTSKYLRLQAARRLHNLKVLAPDNVAAARQRNKQVAYPRRSSMVITSKPSMIASIARTADFGYDNYAAHAARTHCKALPHHP